MVDSTARAAIKRGPSNKRKGTRGVKDKPAVCLGFLPIDIKSLTLAKEAHKEPKLPTGKGNGNDVASSGVVDEVKNPPPDPPFRSDPDGDAGQSMLLFGPTTRRETNKKLQRAVRQLNRRISGLGIRPGILPKFHWFGNLQMIFETAINRRARIEGKRLTAALPHCNSQGLPL